MKVFKFGGTSVGSAARIAALKGLLRNGESKVVVLSAMAGTTNALVEICDQIKAGRRAEADSLIDGLRLKYVGVIEELFLKDEFLKAGREMVDDHFGYIGSFTTGDFTPADEKKILARGELISTALFHLHLKECGVASALVPALNFMRTDKDGEPDYYYISQNLEREMKDCGDAEIIITQGFICRNAAGEIDNLRRGGSDYTASIIGAALEVSEVQIWTDISGFHNNDPRFVEGTSVIRELSFAEAAELAYFGAKILHPSTINPAREKKIPVVLKNTLEPEDPGTVIADITKLEDYKAIAAKDDITVIRITSDRMLNSYGFMSRVYEVFEYHKTAIDMIATSEVSVSLTIDNTGKLDEIVADLRRLGRVETESRQTIVCVVGDFRTDRAGSAPEIFEALNDIPVKMISYGASPISLSLLIDSRHKVEALRSLHRNLFPRKDDK